MTFSVPDGGTADVAAVPIWLILYLNPPKSPLAATIGVIVIPLTESNSGCSEYASFIISSNSSANS